MTRRNLMQLLTVVAVLVLTAGAAMSAAGVKERMLARVPTINALKAKGVIGENSKGYLEVIHGQSAGTADVNAENSDRRQVYDAIAQQQGTTSELVGQRRALQIYESAPPGTWLQTADGSWRQK